MAERAQPVTPWRRPGAISAFGLALGIGLLLLAGAAIAALMMAAGGGGVLSAPAAAYIRHVTFLTFFQATLSAVLALAVAILVARSCWRRASEWQARYLVLFSFLPVVLPTTVAATGLIAVWGQSGVVSTMLTAAGMPPLRPIYGLGAVLLAHVFFNAPLMLRVLSGALAGIPAAQWRLAAQWGLSDWQRFRQIEWPALRRVIPGLLALVFLLCFTSFSLVLMLGGGPSVTTLEVSIYTALRFEFDMALAGRLALLQLVVCAVIVVLLTMVTGRSWSGAAGHKGRRVTQRGDRGLGTRLTDGIVISGFVVLAVVPVGAVIWRGIGPHFGTILSWPSLWQATATSLAIAMLSGGLATGIALILDLSISLYLAVSAIVLGTGLFILLRQVADVFALAPALVVLGNMLVALPFAYRVLEGRLSSLATSQDRLCASLGIRGWRRFRQVTLPALVPELGYAAGLSSALSLGDLTIIALFGSQQFQTLPWLLYQTMGRYRAAEAAALAFWILGLTLAMFTICVLAARLAGRRHHA